MRIVFFGAGAFGVPGLERLAQTHELAAVVTQPDRRAGRKRRMTPTPAAERAEALGIEAIRAEDVNDPDTVARIAALEADAAIVIAFGQKLGPEALEACGGLRVNLHGSLLPRHRGAAPVAWAILAGDRETGVTVIELASRMDAGLVYERRRTPIDPHETAGELHDRLAALGPDALESVLERYEAGRLKGEAQDESAVTRAPKLTKADGWVDLSAPADAVRRRIHGLTPWPGVRVRWVPAAGEPRALILRRVEPGAGESGQTPGAVLEGGRVATGAGEAIRLLEVQPEGRPAMGIDAFLRGHGLGRGDRLEGAEAG